MECAYLGLFQKVFNWVLSRILEPVYRFVSGLLTSVLNWFFEEIFSTLVFPILQDALRFFIDLWLEVVCTRLYLMLAAILKLIDYLETAFDVFIGLRPVTYTTSSNQVIEGPLVEVLMQQETVSMVFWLITIGALGLALLLTIYGTARSAFDLDFENKRPVSKVLTAMMKTFIQFFMVPFLVYFMLKLSAVILTQVTYILNFGNTTTLGRIVFMIASLDAAQEEKYNIGSGKAPQGFVFGTSQEDKARYPFYSLTPAKNMPLKDYGDLGAVTKTFNLADFDFLIGFIAAIFLLFTIGVCLIVFVQRIFELILLYLVSPYFVCMMPLDDGERFNRWREMFIAKCFTGFGSVIGMRLFLMICPMVMGNRIRFGTATSPEMDYMMKLFFLAGGAWAVYKSGSMITSLLNYQAGMSEANTAAVAGGLLYSQTVGRAMAKGHQLLGAGMSRLGAGKGGAAAGKAGLPGGKFDGKKGADSVMRDSKKPGFGTRMKNTWALGRITNRNLSATKASLKSGDYSGAFKSGLRTLDGVANFGRVAMGKEAKAGPGERLRNRFNNTMDFAKRSSETLSESLGRTRDGVMKNAAGMEQAFWGLRGNTTMRQKADILMGVGKNFSELKKDYRQLRQDFGNTARGLKGAVHQVDAGGSKLSVDFSGEVLAREFPGLRFSSNPGSHQWQRAVPQGAERGGSKISIGSAGHRGAPGAGASGTQSVQWQRAVPQGTERSGISIGSPGQAGASGTGAGGAGTRSVQWTQNTPERRHTFSQGQVGCTSIPAVQRVNESSSGRKVTYQSLAVKNLKVSREEGKGTITRRNSI